MADLAALLPKTLSQVDELLAVAEEPGPFPMARTRVSGWCALEHAEHMARADEGELYQLEQALERGRSGKDGSRSGRVHHLHHLKIIRDIRRAFEAEAASGLPQRPAA